MQKKDTASNKALEARLAASEANEAALAATVVEHAGTAALAQAVLPKVGDLVRVQFVRQYIFAGIPGPRKNSYAYAPFAVRECEIADMPEALYERLQNKYADTRPLMEKEKGKWDGQQTISGQIFDPKKGKMVPHVSKLTVSELEKRAITVGLPKSPQV